MPVAKKQISEKWLEKAIDQLNRLCSEAKEFADEGDVLPTDLSRMSTIQILETFQKADAHRPKMGLTVNAEISLDWENTGEHFHAYVKRDGSVQYFRNKTAVSEQNFSSNLTAAVAVA